MYYKYDYNKPLEQKSLPIKFRDPFLFQILVLHFRKMHIIVFMLKGFPFNPHCHTLKNLETSHLKSSKRRMFAIATVITALKVLPKALSLQAEIKEEEERS